MFKTLRNTMAASAIGLALTAFSTTALSASGPVTFLYYNADFYTLLVTAGGVSCGVIPNNVAPEKIAGAVAMLAAAKANGTDVSITCNSLTVNML